MVMSLRSAGQLEEGQAPAALASKLSKLSCRPQVLHARWHPDAACPASCPGTSQHHPAPRTVTAHPGSRGGHIVCLGGHAANRIASRPVSPAVITDLSSVTQ